METCPGERDYLRLQITSTINPKHIMSDRSQKIIRHSGRQDHMNKNQHRRDRMKTLREKAEDARRNHKCEADMWQTFK